MNASGLPNPEEDAERPAPAEPATTGGYQPTNVDDLLKRRHAETASRIVWMLLILFGVFVVCHYVCVMVLIFNGHNSDLPALEDVFHAWLPVLAGFVGSAVTFYFTRNKN